MKKFTGSWSYAQLNKKLKRPFGFSPVYLCTDSWYCERYKKHQDQYTHQEICRTIKMGMPEVLGGCGLLHYEYHWDLTTEKLLPLNSFKHCTT